MLVAIVISIVILQRLVELVVAKRNENGCAAKGLSKQVPPTTPLWLPCI